MSPTFDLLFEEHFASMQAKHVDVEDFIEKYRDSLALFVSGDDLDCALDCIQRGIDPPTAVMLRILEGGSTARNLFARQAAQLDYNLFVQNAVQRVKDLENLNFAIDEVKAFEAIMIGEAKRLYESGHVTFDRKEVPMEFLGEEIKMVVADPHELWRAVFMARVKSIAVRNGLLPALPWETLLLEADGGESLHTTVKVDPAVLQDSKIARRAALKMIGPRPVSFEEARALLHSQAKTLLELEATFRLEITFLAEIAEVKASKLVKEAVMWCLPSDNHRPTLQQALGVADPHCIVGCAPSVLDPLGQHYADYYPRSRTLHGPPIRCLVRGSPGLPVASDIANMALSTGGRWTGLGGPSSQFGGSSDLGNLTAPVFRGQVGRIGPGFPPRPPP